MDNKLDDLFKEFNNQSFSFQQINRKIEDLLKE